MNRGCGPANSPVSRSSPGPKVVLKPANPTFSRLKALKSSADSWTNARSVKGMFFITLMSKFDIPRLRKALRPRNLPGAISPRSPPLDRSPFRSRPARGLMGGPEVMRAIPDQVMPNGSPRTALDVDWWRINLRSRILDRLQPVFQRRGCKARPLDSPIRGLLRSQLVSYGRIAVGEPSDRLPYRNVELATASREMKFRLAVADLPRIRIERLAPSAPQRVRRHDSGD